MYRNPATKIITAPRKNLPTAKLAAAPKFTTRPRNVKKLGLIPVAAIAPTILSSIHLLPVPIAPVSVAIFWWDEACACDHAGVIVAQQYSCSQTCDSTVQLEVRIGASVLFYRFFS